MARLATVSAVLILGLTAIAARMLGFENAVPAQTSPAEPTKTIAPRSEPAQPPQSLETHKVCNLHVIDTLGREVRDVEITLVEQDSRPAYDGPGYRTQSDLTNARGRVRFAVDRRFDQLTFKTRFDDRTIGWARLLAGDLRPNATEDDPARDSRGRRWNRGDCR